MKDFWLSCGHHLLDRDAGGGLVVTDEFLKAYLARPELAPPPDACASERQLHAALMRDPRRPVAAGEIAAIADADARENWQHMIALRGHLLRHPTIEAAYLALVRGGIGKMPPIFVNQLVHVILRNALNDCSDPYLLRAAEMLFRTQRLTLHDGALLAADDERIASSAPRPPSPLVSMLGLAQFVAIDVLNEANAATYWERSDRFDLALDVTAGRPGLAALGRALARFIVHVLGVEVEIAPLIEMNNAPFIWYVGLDSEGTKIGDALWYGDEVDDVARARIVGLFSLTFGDPGLVVANVASQPVYLILAMTPENILRMKPQNLVVGLPIRRFEAVS